MVMVGPTIERSETRTLAKNKMVNPGINRHRFHKLKIGILNLIETSNHRILSTRYHMVNLQQTEVVELMRQKT